MKNNYLEVVLKSSEGVYNNRKNTLFAIVKAIELLNEKKKICININLYEKVKLINEDIQALKKLINKINGYKKITIDILDRDYDYLIQCITFPKGTKKEFKKNWLENNNFPTKSYEISTGCDRDCTGIPFKKIVKYNGNKVMITTYFDL